MAAEPGAHYIQQSEQLSLFPEYPSEWTLSCSCGHIHVTDDKTLHLAAVSQHVKDAVEAGGVAIA